MNRNARHTPHVLSSTNIKSIHVVMLCFVCACVSSIPVTEFTWIDIIFLCIGIISATLITLFIFVTREKNERSNGKKYCFHKSKLSNF